MATDRKLLKRPLQKHSAPPWRCPRCYHGTLDTLPETFVKRETGSSIASSTHPAWDPDWIEERFFILLSCNRKDCDETVSVLGTVHQQQEWDETTSDVVSFDLLRPAYFYPAIPLFQIPENCPPGVAFQIKKAFEHFWCDSSAAMNRIRQAVELLLTHLKVPRYTKTKKALTLHARIQLLLNRQPEIGNPLLATKWLGNEGSHGDGDVEADDVCDAFDLLQYVLEEVIGGRTKSVAQLSKQINKAKGPRKKP